MKTIIFLSLLFPVMSYSNLVAPCDGAKGKAHPKGGGFVADTAKVAKTVIIDRGSWVCGKAQVLGNARVLGFVLISGNARISDNARVSGYARVDGNAKVYGKAQIAGYAQISGYAQVFDNA